MEMQGELVGYVIKFCHRAAGLINNKVRMSPSYCIWLYCGLSSCTGLSHMSPTALGMRRGWTGILHPGSAAAWEMMELHLLP